MAPRTDSDFLGTAFVGNHGAVYTAEPVADLLAILFTAILFFVQFRKVMNRLDSENSALNS